MHRAFVILTTIIVAISAPNKKLLAEEFYVNGNVLEGKISVSPTEQLGRINPDIYGLFASTCYHEFDGGLWAEMLVSRKFAEHDFEDKSFGIVRPWFLLGANEHIYAEHDNSIFYCGSQSQKIVSKNDKEHQSGIGQGRLFLQRQKRYNVRVNLTHQGVTSPVTIALEDESKVLSKKDIRLVGTDWQRFAFDLEVPKTVEKGKFTITFKGPGTLWVGSASLMPADNMSGYRKDVIEALRAIRPSNIRGLGGNNISCWRWKEALGNIDKRPARFDRAFPDDDRWITNDVGIDEFIQLCRLVGARPYIVVNAGDGTAQEAADLVEYCNGSNDTPYGRIRAENGHPEPYNVELWGIGNEMYGNWQIGHVDGQTYAKRHLEFAKAMLAVDKSVRIVAVGARYWKFPRWNQALFETATEYFDYLNLHSYAKKYRRWLKKPDLKDPKLAEEVYYYIVSSPYGIEEQIIETDKEIRTALPNRPEVKIAFGEWNSYPYRSPYMEIDFALRDGICTAGVFHAFRRQAKALTLANFSRAVNCHALIRTNQAGIFLNPQYLVFKMYAEHSGPILLKSQVQCGSFPAPEYEKGRPQAKGQIPWLDVSATMSRDETTVYLAVINLHIHKHIRTQIGLDDWPFSTNVKLLELYDSDYMAENSFEKPDKLTIKEKWLKEITAPFNYNFKPHSVTILIFEKKGPGI